MATKRRKPGILDKERKDREQREAQAWLKAQEKAGKLSKNNAYWLSQNAKYEGYRKAEVVKRANAGNSLKEGVRQDPQYGVIARSNTQTDRKG
jgi:hypothetical protein